MKLNKQRIGDFIEIYNERCGIPNLTVNDVSGINRDKEFFEPSKQVGTNTTQYKVVPPNYFACNLMHVGRDVVLPISMNHSASNKIVSPAYTVFRITDESAILKEYFFMLLKSDEKDRFFWLNTDSSIREGLEWKVFCDIEIELPALEIQEKYVTIYKSLLSNLEVYEQGLDDLKMVCDATIEKLKTEMPSEEIGSYIRKRKEKNQDKRIRLVQGIESAGQFIPTKANMMNINIANYNIVRLNDIVYNPSRINIGSIALCKTECIVSPMYEVFEIINSSKLMPEYLMMWLSRKETLRYTLFYAVGSVRDSFNIDLMKEIKMPIPNIEIQESIVAIYNAYITRIEIIKKLKELINEICPILIKGSIEEGSNCEEV